MSLRGKHNNFLDLIGDCFSSSNGLKADLFCIVVSRIWFCRNSTFHDAKKHQMSKVVNWSSNFLQEFQNSKPVFLTHDVSGNRPCSRWQPPAKETYKANCDAELDIGNGQVGTGMIIRNSSGLVLASCSLVSRGNQSAKVAKLMAVLNCLQFSIDCGLAVGIVETDDAGVVKWINEVGYLDADFGLVISKIRKLKVQMGDVTFSHTRKIANKVANKLALCALRTKKDTYWMEECPPCIRQVVEVDMPVCSDQLLTSNGYLP
ncbi:hypothetical protein Q3G72_034437 [Acer saccharum]|nr:hypothetical protein Q3G72_034437 [Acer saccharum]